MITKEQIKPLYQKYLDAIKWETTELGCKPTEVRHLIGRLGEFYCALYTGGDLAKLTNQQGFDVVTNEGRRISVKTTAQKNGFVSINCNTLDKLDDLMLLQFRDNELLIAFYNSVEIAKSAFRLWKNHFELDLSKAKRLANKNTGT